MKTYDLNKVMISPRIRDTWFAMTQIAMTELSKQYPNLTEADVPDEQFRILPDKTGEIFCKVRNKEIKLRVPYSEYNINQ